MEFLELVELADEAHRRAGELAHGHQGVQRCFRKAIPRPGLGAAQENQAAPVFHKLHQAPCARFPQFIAREVAHNDNLEKRQLGFLHVGRHVAPHAIGYEFSFRSPQEDGRVDLLGILEHTGQIFGLPPRRALDIHQAILRIQHLDRDR